MAYYGRFKVSCGCGDNLFDSLKEARQHAEYEMKESMWPNERWSYTIYRHDSNGFWKPYEKIKRVRVIEKIGGGL